MPLLGCVLLFAAFGWVSGLDARTFTDTQGRKVEAEIVRVDGPNVVLRLADGKEHPVPLQQFSATDQEYIRSWTPAETAASEPPSSAAAPDPTTVPQDVGGEMVFDYEAELPSSSPVGIANSRIWVPSSEPVRGMIVMVPGVNGDGRGAATNKGWQKLARELGFGLVGVHFKDKDPGSAVYCNADNGSGEAILDALEEFAEKHNHPEVEDAPLLLWGHSAGGQFNFNFACIEPKRVLGFVVNKGGYYYDRATDNDVRKIPAILFLGKQDKGERVQNITKLFDENRGRRALWALCEEPGGHGIGKSREVAEVFFRSVVAMRLPETGLDRGIQDIDQEEGWLGNNETGEIAPFKSYEGDDDEASWLPDEATARAWQAAIK